MVDRILVVEGEEDQKFFQAFCRTLDFEEIDVRCHPSGKGNAIKTFGASLLKQTRASKARVGLVVDADYGEFGAGHVATVNNINSQLKTIHYQPLAEVSGGGYKSARSDCPALRAGVWVMPNNAHDGYIEHLLLDCVQSLQQKQLQYARRQCQIALDSSSEHGLKFPVRPHHVVKAEIGTWLAWQDPPRMSFAKAMQEQLFDSLKLASLSSWLKWLFS